MGSMSCSIRILSIQPNAAFKVLKSWIGAERIETRPQEDAGVEPLFITFV
jgi:hypothetical protein